MNFKSYTGILLMLAIILLLPACSNAQTEKDNDTDQQATSSNTLLWKIEGNNLDQPSYLYGTIHLIPKKDFTMGEQLEKVIEKSDVLVMELDLDMGNMMGAMSKMMLPDTVSLETYLSESQYDSLQTFMQDSMGISGMQLNMMNRMKPFYVSQMFYGNILGEEPMSFEMTFKSMADSQGMETMGLETVEEQLAILDSIPLNAQVDMLMEAVRDFNSVRQEYKEMVKLYNAQKVDSLLGFMNESEEDFMEFESFLLANRNKRWINKLENILGDQQYFIAVGAAHLPGENGVINLLKKRGYTLTPLSTK